MGSGRPDTLILGGGLAGLSAAAVLSRAGRSAVVVEAGAEVGGLARTFQRNGFRFDLGGHRFLTNNAAIGSFVAELLRDELLDVPRSSKILLRGRYFDYPLRPANALFGLGIPTTLRILTDYGKERLSSAFRTKDSISLEDWVVHRFGRAMFDLYFREYSEKVWGVACSRISAEWVSQRIAGLSLWEAVKNAFSRRSGRDIATLADRFFYPRLGIGRISERLREVIEARNEVRTGTAVLRIHQDGHSIRRVLVRTGSAVEDVDAESYVSSLPLTNLVRCLHPSPPAAVLAAAGTLRFRDLVVVTVMLDRPRVTDLSWLYFPEKQVPLGRVHEPGNWSPDMAPEGKTHVVAEFFCSQGDAVWNASDDALTELTVRHLARCGLVRAPEVIGSFVIRVPKAYPLLDTGYRKHHETIMRYLRTFKNLQVIGRGGTFRYLNMDHAIGSGIAAAGEILNRRIGSGGDINGRRSVRIGPAGLVETLS